MSESETIDYTAALAIDELEFLNSDTAEAVAELFSRYRGRLLRMVTLRLDRRLYGRIDAADVLQEAYLEVSRRIDSYLSDPRVSFFVWARQITWQTLLTAHRRHFGQKRNPGHEQRGRWDSCGDETSFPLAEQLVGQLTSPSQAAMRAERLTHLRTAIDAMDETDREIIALRHFEQLGNSEAAEILGLKETAASNRYVRALTRLKQTLGSRS